MEERLAELESKIGALESEKTAQAAEITRLNGVCDGVDTALTTRRRRSPTRK